MTRDEALAFLRAHQPMPDDRDLSEELITAYDLVRRYFTAHPDPACIPLFLNSFGERSGFGVYQLVEDVLAKFPPGAALPHLVEALTHGRRPSRYWAALWAGDFPNALLSAPLIALLDQADCDLRSAAALSLEYIPGQRADDALRRASEREADEHVREVIDQAIENRSRATPTE